MSVCDRQPLQGTPVTQRIISSHDNRLGAVYSALYGLWAALQGTINPQGRPAVQRRDAYSVILFNDAIATALENDFTSTPDNLLDAVLQHHPHGGTNYDLALTQTLTLMEKCWSTERQD
jgi:hypothetical protein